MTTGRINQGASCSVTRSLGRAVTRERAHASGGEDPSRAVKLSFVAAGLSLAGRRNSVLSFLSHIFL